MSDFTFNGVSASSLGLKVSGKNPFNSPQKIYDKYTVPGRSGDIYIPTGAYSNVPLIYEVYIKRTSNMSAVAQALRKWLLMPDGYCRLTDTYNAGNLRLARFDGNLDIVLGCLYRTGTATITFDCKPQIYNNLTYNIWLNVVGDEDDAYGVSNTCDVTDFLLYKCTFLGGRDSTITIQSSSIRSTVIGKIVFDSYEAQRAGQSVVYYDSELNLAYYEDGTIAPGAVTVTGDVTMPPHTQRFFWYDENTVTIQKRGWHL